MGRALPIEVANSSWRRCFNDTEVRATYIHNVYGRGRGSGMLEAAAFREFDWRTVKVIYPWLMAGLNHSCLHASELVYRRMMFGATFVDYQQRKTTPNGEHVNAGGLRAQPRVSVWPWTEVLHSPGYGVRSMGSAEGTLWMYVAPGSGLWFDPGRVLELSDTVDLAIFLNESRHYHSRSPASKTDLLRRGAWRRAALAKAMRPPPRHCQPSVE